MRLLLQLTAWYDFAAIQASMNSNSGANVEYKICNWTGKKVRLDQWSRTRTRCRRGILPFFICRLGGEKMLIIIKSLRTEHSVVLSLTWLGKLLISFLKSLNTLNYFSLILAPCR